MESLIREFDITAPEDCITLLKYNYGNHIRFWSVNLRNQRFDWNSLYLLKTYFAQYPSHVSEVIVSVKGSLGPHNSFAHGYDTSRKGVEKCVQQMLSITEGEKIFHISHQSVSTARPTSPIPQHGCVSTRTAAIIRL
ncbi:hypothetical protein BCR34DRAFT_81307 [Clohesyomyces aquaticus]|uniref:Uncharacterized protein n=1 Tax=Clohesyomyces aquaticus TaxID=1231657 RepID=A0A1Y1YWK9_9PLEO|nr:hypothetical protein BCR34DRAFT_81307 [Clohesyomyces aquaticus]